MNYDVSQLFSVLKNPPIYPGYFKGRGLVISAGGSYLASAYVAVKSLRHVGCTLPIQIWHLGPLELPPPLIPLFQGLGVETVDCLEIAKVHKFKKLGGWQSKPFSIMWCPFEQVFSFDADNFALLNPELLFDSPEFLEAGAMFWSDFYFDREGKYSIKDKAWTMLGLEPRRGAELETGQVLIDKKRCWNSLVGAVHMNEESDFYYNNCTYGDTGTYALSWALTGQKLYSVPHRPTLQNESIRIHYTPDGQELFQHCRKWALPSSVNPKLSSYRNEELGFEWLNQFESFLAQFT